MCGGEVPFQQGRGLQCPRRAAGFGPAKEDPGLRPRTPWRRLVRPPLYRGSRARAIQSRSRHGLTAKGAHNPSYERTEAGRLRCGGERLLAVAGSCFADGRLED